MMLKYAHAMCRTYAGTRAEQISIGLFSDAGSYFDSSEHSLKLQCGVEVRLRCKSRHGSEDAINPQGVDFHLS